jgi:tRNA(Ile)-lysidine synthetase-like protein
MAVNGMRKLLSLIRHAVDEYNMIDEGDKIAVGLSGGKDSTVLLCALSQLQKFYPKKFELVGIAIDPKFDKIEGDYSELKALCDSLDVPFVVKRTDLYEIIFEVRKESCPCSLCSRMRRGILHDTCKELGCNIIALGHHMDDAVETFFMNLLQNGRAECFSPMTYMSRKDLYQIRPMIYVREKDIYKYINQNPVPVFPKKCKADGFTTREDTKNLLADLSKKYKKLPQKVITALKKSHISGW